MRNLVIMKSTHFEFLRASWPELASLGGFAERYVHVDPSSALVKLRTFAERVVLVIYHQLGLHVPPYQPNLIELLRNEELVKRISKTVLDKLHVIRIQGNKAAHGAKVNPANTLVLLEEAFNLGRWLAVAFNDVRLSELPTFQESELPTRLRGEDLEKERRALYRKLAAREAEMKQLLEELNEARQKAEGAQISAEERNRVYHKAEQAAANVLHFDEATTRKRLIDTMLAGSGWDLDNQAEVVCEEPVPYQPTPSKSGNADYVLKDPQSGLPLAVIEAKKTSIDPKTGQRQAKDYADGLEKKYGRRPLIFYTNGFETWVWNDAEGEPPRRIYGLYSPDSIQYVLYQRDEKSPPDGIPIDRGITDRAYQMEAVKRVAEHFAAKHRRALIVQATGTGKTRVAISLSDVLTRARWTKRVLFLCDRLELRKQANNAFKEFLPGEPRTYITAATAQDRDKRVYLATYPAMMKCFESFDVGFFDLIIADESHRSVYNRYREIFQYFDALQVGLTATPVNYVHRNTFKLFGCGQGDPTVHYSYQEAIDHRPPFLSRFQVEIVTTPFLRKGIKYKQLTPEQREQLDDEEEHPELIDYDAGEVDRLIFNKDTNRHILRNLMENGIRDRSGTRPGKTIVFARNHKHAMLLQGLFDEMYPQYGGNFCQVIDNYDPRAEELIDDFKGLGKNPDLTIAISVDMLDTGIDVPEIVNLVFAKPVRSYAKFWQMIGRGTRICKDLFGSGQDKTQFQIFDHWGNFEFFEEDYQQREPGLQKSITQQLYETRIDLAEEALKESDIDAFEMAIALLVADARDLPDTTIAVKEKWQQVNAARNLEVVKKFDGKVKILLRNDVAPLMQWRNISGHVEACRFDLLVTQTQLALLRGSTSFDDQRNDFLNRLDELAKNLGPVKAKAKIIQKVRSREFWDAISVSDLEEARKELRGIMKYRERFRVDPIPPRVIDVTEDEHSVQRRHHRVKLEGLDMVAYRERVERVLQDLFETSEVLQKIKKGVPVSEQDLEDLTALVLGQDPRLDLQLLGQFYPEAAGDLQVAIRGIIGLDAEAVNRRFDTFLQRRDLSAKQLRFLALLKNHISKYGSIELERLYQPPFTTLDSNGIDGVFPEDQQANEILEILNAFRSPSLGESAQV